MTRASWLRDPPSERTTDGRFASEWTRKKNTFVHEIEIGDLDK